MANISNFVCPAKMRMVHVSELVKWMEGSTILDVVIIVESSFKVSRRNVYMLSQGVCSEEIVVQFLIAVMICICAFHADTYLKNLRVENF